MNDLGATDGTTPGAIAELGFDVEIACLREMIADWVAGCDREMRAALEWQFLEGSKYFRPLTVFSCYRAAHNGPIPQQIMNSALVIEFFHNVSLIIDDIVDKSPMRRGRPTLHNRFGELSALMTAGYIVADGYARLARDLEASNSSPNCSSGLVLPNACSGVCAAPRSGSRTGGRSPPRTPARCLRYALVSATEAVVCDALAGFWVFCITAAMTSAISAAPTRSAEAGRRTCVTGS